MIARSHAERNSRSYTQVTPIDGQCTICYISPSYRPARVSHMADPDVKQVSPMKGQIALGRDFLILL